MAATMKKASPTNAGKALIFPALRMVAMGGLGNRFHPFDPIGISYAAAEVVPHPIPPPTAFAKIHPLAPPPPTWAINLRSN
jgi:hypothetical protein